MTKTGTSAEFLSLHPIQHLLLVSLGFVVGLSIGLETGWILTSIFLGILSLYLMRELGERINKVVLYIAKTVG